MDHPWVFDHPALGFYGLEANVKTLVMLFAFYAPPQPIEPILIEPPHQPAPVCAEFCGEDAQ